MSAIRVGHCFVCRPRINQVVWLVRVPGSFAKWRWLCNGCRCAQGQRQAVAA